MFAAFFALLLAAADFAGWFVWFRVEGATILVGLVLLVVNLLPQRNNLWLQAIGLALASAGLFDLLDWGAPTKYGDWLTGWVAGFAVAIACLWHRGLPWRFAIECPTGMLRLAYGGAMLCLLVLLRRSFVLFLPIDWNDTLPLLLVAALLGVFTSAMLHRAGGIPLRLRTLLFDAAALVLAVWCVHQLSNDKSWVSWGWLGLPGALVMAHYSDAPRPLRVTVVLQGLVWFAAFWFAALGIVGSLLNLEVARMVSWNSALLPMSRAQFAWFAMRDSYLWADQLPAEPGAGLDAGEFIRAARLPADRFSRAVPAEKLFGREKYFGFSVAYGENGYWVTQVNPASGAGRAGVERGWILVDEPTAEGNAVFRIPPGKTTRTVNLGSGDERAVTSSVLNWDATPVGYLYLDGFARRFRDSTDAAFREFSAAGIRELVIDLRYNLGGTTNAATHLASLIASPMLSGEALITERHNERYRDLNWNSGRFDSRPHALGLRRVFILTGGMTCSSSEALINGLRPFVEVVTIGQTTCGKPYGFRPLRFRGTDFLLISFELGNARGEGQYTMGIPAQCKVEDRVDIYPGSRDDPSLAAARHYALHGQCAAPARG
ncbi:MAG: S41 family peptidase [Burkholderiales bacterium]